ncbi:MAG: epoxyqueuosine reductase QueH [bacterium]|nr:epoxyqueuosine reductase QueH [bacterium]
MSKPKLLLHICCATCAAYVLKELQSDYDVTAYYYNPNIYPAKEYAIRFEEAKKFCVKNNIEFIEESPDQDRWFELTKGHETDPERGDRCTLCYRMRLERTARYAKEKGFWWFGTDLSISPHKDADKLNEIGNNLAKSMGLKFLEANFKKNDGFKKAMDISRCEDFYRQDYCGCLYSMRRRNYNNQIPIPKQ